jgi:hypothetical protein
MLTKYQALVICLKKLPPARRRNLGYHYDKGTTVIWNGNADKFADGNGGACVTLLAVTRDVPRRVIRSVWDRPSWKWTLTRLDNAADSMGLKFFEIIRDLTPAQIRSAMYEARLW